MAKETSSGAKPAAKKTTTRSAGPKKTTTKSTTKSAGAAKASTPKRKSVSKTTTKTASAKTTTKAKKPVQKSVSPAGAPPMVDTNFAAQAAARMLATRAKLAKAAGGAPQGDAAAIGGGASEAHHESGLFKQMKESINKPSAGGLSSAMGNTFGPNKTNLPNPDKGHVVRDQTSSNVGRVNVPRRTGG